MMQHVSDLAGDNTDIRYIQSPEQKVLNSVVIFYYIRTGRSTLPVILLHYATVE
jgi:hypothetical protein